MSDPSTSKEFFDVRVSEQHQLEGKRQDPCKCPIGLALSDATGGRRFAVGVDNYCEVALDGNAISFDVVLPKHVADYRRLFDQGKSPAPIQFRAVVVK